MYYDCIICFVFVYRKGDWKTVILQLNSVVTRCCSDGGVHQHMVDVLIMLTEAYYCLNRYV